MPEGTVKKLILEKGFGFIAGNPRDLFFHRSAVVDGSFDTLSEGQKVEYELDDDGDRGRGPRARSVKPIQG